MTVELNHTIVHATDPHASATFLSELLGLASPKPFGPFYVVDVANGVSIDYIAAGDHPIHEEHYAFLVTEPEFDEIFGRIKDWGLDHWSDPGRNHPGEINTHDGGRGVYFPDPDGHYLEIITRPYGSGTGG